MFSRANNAWSQQAYIKASNTEAGDQFGWSIALSADGNTLAVGASYEVSAGVGVGGSQAEGSGSGAAYIFAWTTDVWSQRAYVKASNLGGTFGDAIALSADGNILAVSASRESSAATGINGDQVNQLAEGAGAAYLY